MTPDEYCQDKAAKSGSSFYCAFRYLSPERRRAIVAFYAFCREVDNIVDEVTDPFVARTKLDYWRREIDALYLGKPSHPVTLALAPHIEPMHLPQTAFHIVIDGMQQDLEITRYIDFKGLQAYCYRAAGVVGEVSARIFGMAQPDNPQTLLYARTLGEALQLTNIIRDVGEDARRGRIYLPASDLQTFFVPAAELMRGESSERFNALMKMQCARAKATYTEAIKVLPAEDKKNQRPGLAMGAIYAALLDEIERDGFNVLTHRVSLTPIRKLWLAWKTMAFA